MRCPDLVAGDLSGFWRCSKPGDRDATRGTDGAISEGVGAVSRRAIELHRGSGVIRGQRALRAPDRGSRVRRLVWGFSCQAVVLGFAHSSLFGAGKAVLRPVACDQVPGARGRGQGTETLASLAACRLSVACVSQRLDA